MLFPLQMVFGYETQPPRFRIDTSEGATQRKRGIRKEISTFLEKNVRTWVDIFIPLLKRSIEFRYILVSPVIDLGRTYFYPGWVLERNGDIVFAWGK